MGGGEGKRGRLCYAPRVEVSFSKTLGGWRDADWYIARS